MFEAQCTVYTCILAPITSPCDTKLCVQLCTLRAMHVVHAQNLWTLCKQIKCTYTCAESATCISTQITLPCDAQLYVQLSLNILAHHLYTMCQHNAQFLLTHLHQSPLQARRNYMCLDYLCNYVPYACMHNICIHYSST